MVLTRATFLRQVTPGLIECHSHIVFGGQRATEWELKLKGATYEEVAKAGGGIVNSVSNTRKASVAELVKAALPRVRALMSEGVTTLEIKSGYGLDVDGERKMLQAARALGKLFPEELDVRATYLGAHAVPKEYKGRPDAYIDDICCQQLPILKAEGLVDACDAFCESIGFSVAQTSRLFDVSRSLGIPVRIHGDQLNDFGCGQLAADYNALSCDHCEYMTEPGIRAMAQKGVVAVLLPSSNYFIKVSVWALPTLSIAITHSRCNPPSLQEPKKPDMAAMRKHGVDIALGTNTNPGSSPTCSILLVLNMACTLFGMMPDEALAGVTRNAAKALGMQETVGTIEVGKQADLVVWDCGEICELAYFLGLNQLHAVYKRGHRIAPKTHGVEHFLQRPQGRGGLF